MNAQEKRRRLLEAAVAVLQGASDHSLKIVLLNKALFYADLVSLRDHGETLTGNTYIALEAGPVVAHYQKRLIRALEEEGFARQEADNGAKPVSLIKAPEEFLYLDEKDRERAGKMGGVVSGWTSAGASDLSHENAGWQLAWRQGGGASLPPRPINLLLALQQMSDADPWLDEPLTPEEEQSISGCDEEEAVDW